MHRFNFGDTVITLSDRDHFGHLLYPVGTVGTITAIDDDSMPYCVRAEDSKISYWYKENDIELYSGEKKVTDNTNAQDIIDEIKLIQKLLYKQTYERGNGDNKKRVILLNDAYAIISNAISELKKV